MQLTVRDVSKFLKRARVHGDPLDQAARAFPPSTWAANTASTGSSCWSGPRPTRSRSPLEAFDHLEADDEPGPSLVEALEAGGIFHQVKNTNKEHRPAGPWSRSCRFRRASTASCSCGSSWPGRLRRARRSATASRLPHVRNPIVLHVVRPMVTLCFLEHPVDFGALDGKPVHVLFSLICPTVRSHLQTLSRLSYALHDEKFKGVVMRQGQREEILREARRVEAALAAPAAGAGR